MREILYIVTLTSIVCWTTGCSSSSDTTPEGGEVVTPQERAIGFAPSFAVAEGNAAGQRTRAVGDGELTTALLQEKGFGVYCWYTGTDNFTNAYEAKTVLMQNQRVTYSGAYWTYSPTKYWPLADNEKLTLRAYAPYVSYQLQTHATTGLPLLPVVVDPKDYHNGTQHDPLWGTGKHDGTADSDDDATANEVYGKLYDNYTYTMSGDLLAKDANDGTIHWYFHHGMASLMFTCSVIADPGCDSVIIKSIEITPLYDKGLLSLSSHAGNKDEKPDWTDTSGNMTVKLTEGTPATTAGDLAPRPGSVEEDPKYIPYPFAIKTGSAATEPVNLLSTGLLVIPRHFSDAATGETPRMVVTVKYTIDAESEEQTAIGYVENTTFYGNTSYKVGLTLTPATRGMEIDIVQSAFTNWNQNVDINHEVYNW